ncbi:uncharacterized protein LOC131046507 [Cryptomeria japonica]|uniref:uncharacterized protein LOC131046507 n=1 Tax=Cryptomeria japonica TaxID=3369 RepID=UPI0027D9F00F|nr:uncharacterized protein LOC131046507 [Cryptomeria japonica]
MRITTWNVRGIIAPDKRRMLKRHLARLASEVILIQETKCNLDEGNRFVSNMKEWSGLFQPAVGRASGLGVLWRSFAVEVERKNGGSNWIQCKIRCKQRGFEFYLWNVYGPKHSKEKETLWEELYESQVATKNEKIIMGGDYNALLDLTEKKGGTNKITKDMLAFGDFIRRCNLSDCIPLEGWFTWTNRRRGFSNIAERLDRFLSGNEWLKEGIQLTTKVLPLSLSDHYPVQLEVGERI